ncbi:hypothetical protein GGU10DRAFT_186425 [Lentinula aff. detonsa]|uniref:Uncharacterized protein n=1 Tax=Lentinula aff. detonsa TaxID=2804958 RepID=A0AA38KQQ2_9AGAR|nr:hypothetical protein GGU10DRAFT_186425 [Lentinula aff. detonsa]
MLPFSNLFCEPLPPSIDELLTNREQILQRYPRRNFSRWRISRASLSFFSSRDNASASFYRLYEFVVLGWTIQLRNELEYFCTSHPGWAVSDLPDPADTKDPARYAFLAGLTYLMCEAFNRRIELGLPRDAPAIVTDWEELKRRPQVLERVPDWVKSVSPLAEAVRIPDEKGNFVDTNDPEVCTPLSRFNIIMPYPHIHFI